MPTTSPSIHAPRRARRVVVASVLLALLPGTAVVASASSPDGHGALGESAGRAKTRPVLGSSGYAPYSEGFGTARPDHFYNGGAPSGSASDLTWGTWGGKRAFARGKTPLYKPSGGYYARPGNIRVRAQRLGTCSDGTYGYTRMYVKVAERPGESAGGPWRPWGPGPGGDICYYLGD